MSIFIDPTETRAGTRLPDEVYQSGIVLEGLEAYTGADLLVSAIGQPVVTELSLSIPNKMAFDKHLKAGVLIQRKSGRDLLGSINHLAEIEARMQQHQTLLPPMLLYTGEFKVNRDYTITVNGMSTGYDYSAMGAALDYWDYRGGKVKYVINDAYIPHVIAREILPQLRRMMESPQAMAKRPTIQSLFLVPPQVDWLLQSRTGIGEEKAVSLMEFCGTLANVLCYLSDISNVKDKGRKVAGIGLGTIAAFRQLLQLPDGLNLGLYSTEGINDPQYPVVSDKPKPKRR